MQDGQSSSTVSLTPPPKGTKKRSLLVTFAVFFALFAIAVGVLSFWQYYQTNQAKSKANEATEKLAAATKQLDEAKKSLAEQVKASNDLQEKYDDAQTKIKSQKKELSEATNKPVVAEPTQEDLDLVVNDAVTTYYDQYGLKMVAVSITLTNKTNAPVEISPNAYQLRDNENHTFTEYAGNGGFGKKFVPLENQTLAPGASVTGAIAIRVSDNNVLDYTLVIGTDQYKVVATKGPSWPIAD